MLENVEGLDSIKVRMRRKPILVDSPIILGRFDWTLRDKDGNIKWKGESFNSLTNQGKNHWLGVEFHGDTQLTSWYIGLINNSGFSGFAAGDTLASHAGWTEYTNYSGNRQAWGPGAASGQQITNSSPAAFTFTTSSGSVYGGFLCSVATGTSGTLFSTTAILGGAITVNVADVMDITYTISS